MWRWLFAMVAGVGSIIGGVVLRRSVYVDPQALADWGAGDFVPQAGLGWALVFGGICAVTLAASHAMSASLLPTSEKPSEGDVGEGFAGGTKVPRARVVRHR